MAGYTKKMCQKHHNSTETEITQMIYSIIPVLPCDYTFDTVFLILKKFYTHEMFIISDTHSYYETKQKELEKRKKGVKRYYYKTPEQYIRNSNIFKKIISYQYKQTHKKNFNQLNYEEETKKFELKRAPKIKKIINKIEKIKRKTQQVSPNHIERTIGLYSRKRTSQKDKVYILKDLQKYYSPEINDFFSKLIDTEYNFQLRKMAFDHLTSLGFKRDFKNQKYMSMNTSNKKRKIYLRKYANETFQISQIPEELEYRIFNSKDQQLKKFDFFISHSSSDYESIQNLITILNNEKKDIYCDWINDTDYLKRHLVGETTLNILEDRLKKSDKLIFVISENSIRSKWCIHELNFFNSLKKEIIFIDKDSINPTNYHKNLSFNIDSLLDINYRRNINNLFEV